jgi:hypothetical protein
MSDSQNRGRRAGVEDRWFKTVRNEAGDRVDIPSATHGRGNRWRARYVDGRGREHARGFDNRDNAESPEQG